MARGLNKEELQNLSQIANEANNFHKNQGAPYCRSDIQTDSITPKLILGITLEQYLTIQKYKNHLGIVYNLLAYFAKYNELSKRENNNLPNSSEICNALNQVAEDIKRNKQIDPYNIFQMTYGMLQGICKQPDNYDRLCELAWNNPELIIALSSANISIQTYDMPAYSANASYMIAKNNYDLPLKASDYYTISTKTLAEFQSGERIHLTPQEIDLFNEAAKKAFDDYNEAIKRQRKNDGGTSMTYNDKETIKNRMGLLENIMLRIDSLQNSKDPYSPLFDDIFIDFMDFYKKVCKLSPDTISQIANDLWKSDCHDWMVPGFEAIKEEYAQILYDECYQSTKTRQFEQEEHRSQYFCIMAETINQSKNQIAARLVAALIKNSYNQLILQTLQENGDKLKDDDYPYSQEEIKYLIKIVGEFNNKISQPGVNKENIIRTFITVLSVIKRRNQSIHSGKTDLATRELFLCATLDVLKNSNPNHLSEYLTKAVSIKNPYSLLAGAHLTRKREECNPRVYRSLLDLINDQKESLSIDDCKTNPQRSTLLSLAVPHARKDTDSYPGDFTMACDSNEIAKLIDKYGWDAVLEALPSNYTSDQQGIIINFTIGEPSDDLMKTYQKMKQSQEY